MIMLQKKHQTIFFTTKTKMGRNAICNFTGNIIKVMLNLKSDYDQ